MNGLKTIFSRITTLPKAIKALEDVGVSINDLEGNVRPVEDILAELAGTWNTLSKAQQQSTAINVAGTYQLSRFTGLMNGFDIAVSATESSINSQGSAMDENAKYMDSLAARTARMKTAWDTLALAFGEAVISDSIVGLTSALTALINTVTPAVKQFGALPIVFGLIGIGLVTLNTGFKLFIINIVNTVRTLLGLPVAATATTFSLKAMTAGLFSAGTATKILTGAIRGLISATVIGGIFTVIGFALEKLIGHFADASDAVDSYSDAQEKITKSNDSLQTLKNLRDEYIKLSKQQHTTLDDSARLKTIQNELSSTYGISAEMLDRNTGNMKDAQKAIQDRVDILTQETALLREKAELEYKSQASSVNDSIRTGTDELKGLQSSYEDAIKASKEFMDSNQQPKQEDFYNIESFQYALDEYDKDASELNKVVEDRKNELDKKQGELNQNILKKSEALKASLQNYLDTMEGQGKKISAEGRAMANTFGSVLARNPDLSDTDFTRMLPEIGKKIQEMTNIEVKPEFDENGIRIFGKSVQDTTLDVNTMLHAIERFAKQDISEDDKQAFLTELARAGSAAADALETVANDIDSVVQNSLSGKLSMEGLIEKFEEVSDPVKDLNKILYDLNRNQKMTSEEVAELIVKYPELANSAHEAADGWSFEREAVEALRQKKIGLLNTSIDTERKRVKDLVNNVISNINTYGLEIDAINEVADAKMALADLDSKLAEANKVQSDFDFLVDLSTMGFPDEIKKEMADARAAQSSGVDALLSDRRDILSEARGLIESEITDLGGLEEQAAALGKTLSDVTYGTTAQADAQKEAEEATKATKKAQEDLNSKYSDTVTILTEVQKAMKDLDQQQQKAQDRQRRLREGSKEWQKALAEESKAIREQIKILESADATDLISTTATTKYQADADSNSSSTTGGTSTTSNTGLQSLFTKANELASADAFDYQQISGKFEGSFNDFLKRGISDCSQYVQEMYEEFLGITLPRTAAEQAKLGESVSKENLQPGDLVFFNTTGKANSHVGIYVGNGKFTQMGTKGLTSQSDLNGSYWSQYYTGAKRLPELASKNKETTPSVNTIPTSKPTYTGKYAKEINTSASKHGVDPNIIAAIIKAESNFNPNSVNGKSGATGLMQLMKGTADGLGVKDRKNAAQNIEGGTSYYAQMLRKYGDPIIALYAYNWGPGNVDKWIKNGKVMSDLPKETERYGRVVPANYAGFTGGGDYTPSVPTPVGGGAYVTEYSSISTQDLIDAEEKRQQDLNKLNNDLYDVAAKSIQAVITDSERTIGKYDNYIASSQRRQSNESEGSSKYNAELNKQIEYETQQIALIQKQNATVASLVKEKGITDGRFDEGIWANNQKIEELKQSISDKLYSQVTFGFAKFEKQVEASNRELGKSEKIQENLAEGSAAYGSEIQRQIKLKKQVVTIQKQEIASIQKALKSGKLTNAQAEELRQKLSELTLNNWEINLTVKDDISRYIDNQLTSFSDTEDRINSVSVASQSKMKMLEEGSKEWRQEINNQISDTLKLIDVNKLRIAYLTEQIKRTDLDAAAIKGYTVLLRDAKNQQLDYNATLKELQDSRFDVDKMIEDFKKMINKRRDLEMKSFDESKEKEDKRHEDYMKNIEEEQDAFEKFINAQIEARDRRDASEDYEKELRKKLKEREKLTAEMNLWMNDDSFEGKKRRSEIQTQLDTINEDIDQYTLNRRREMEKQSLQDQLKDKKENNENIKKDEEKLNKNNLKLIEKDKKAREQYYEDLENNEEYWYTLRKNLMNEDKNIVTATLDEMKAKYGEFFQYLKDNAGLLTEQGMKNAQYDANKSKDTLTDYGDQVVKPPQNGGVTAVESSWNAYLANKKKADELTKKMQESTAANKTGTPTKYYNTLKAQMEELRKKNNTLRTQYGFPDGSYESLKNMKPFSAESGGMTPAGIGKEGKFLLAHEKELVLKKTDTSNLLSTMKDVRAITSDTGVNGLMGSIANMFKEKFKQSSQSSTNNDNGMVIQNVNIYANDKDTGNSLMNKFQAGLKKNMNLRNI